MLSKDILGLIAVAINITSCLNYTRYILKGRIKPHALTWLVWLIISGIISFAQWKQGAGAGAWAVQIGTLFCFTFFFLSLFKGEKNITKTDWVAFTSALAIIPIWYFTKNALFAVILATLIDACAYYPTVRKAWFRPYEEDFIMYGADVLKWVFAFQAMSDYSATTLLYPIFCTTANSSLTIMILVRRKKLRFS